MTFFGMALLTAIGTLVLAVFAFATALYARKAFREQSREVAAIEQQVKDEQEVTRQQAELLKVQTGQLEVLRAQLDDQREATAAQAEVLALQAAELRRSLEERVREGHRRVREQAILIFLTESRYGGRSAGPLDSKPPSITATVVNSSNQPIYETDVYWFLSGTLYGEPQPDHLGVTLPGQSVVRTREFPPGTDLSDCHTELTFRDNDNLTWKRRADGYLDYLLVPRGPWPSLNAVYRKGGA